MQTDQQEAGGQNNVNIFFLDEKDAPRTRMGRVSFVGWQCDELFIPAAAAGISNNDALFYASYDMSPVHIFNGTVMVSERWARIENPKRTKLYDKILKLAIEARESSNPEA